MKTVFLVRRKIAKWRRQFDTLEEAQEFAKTDVFMKDAKDVVIEKIVTERIWTKGE